MAVRATVLKLDGTTEAQVFEGDEAPLRWLQEQVGGYIEIVPTNEHTVYCNEEAPTAVNGKIVSTDRTARDMLGGDVGCSSFLALPCQARSANRRD